MPLGLNWLVPGTPFLPKDLCIGNCVFRVAMCNLGETAIKHPKTGCRSCYKISVWGHSPDT